ncbi:3-oxoacyl-ACP synthase [Bacillus anthracis]|nr:3-oxoacyl-ACP synthase [Bacillus anthracis]
MMNSSMPKGRTMVKWQAFASMPEQFEGIQQIIQEQQIIAKPLLTEDQKEQIEQAIIRSFQQKEEIHISYYRDGYISQVYITVIHIDLNNKVILCTDAFGLNASYKIEELIDIL